jgi:UDP-N-acetylmuramoyl-tripeptide--D-alanyl-D-alanine ligase
MGMNHLFEIDYLTRMLKPDVALIIMAGTAHIGELGGREAIAQAKGEILVGLPRDGIAVINMHDRFGEYWRGLAGDRRVIGFGVLPEDEVQGEFSAEALTIRHGGKSVTVHLHVAGEHNQRNALAAAAAAIAVGVPLATIGEGLEDFDGVAGRLRTYEGHGGATIIDDTYNANPDSVRAAIDVLKTRRGKRLLVLGDMGELGPAAREMHGEIGVYAQNANLDGVFALGQLTESTVMAMGASGWHFDSIDELVQEVLPLLTPNATVLVKGSRFMKMERVVAKLVPNFHGTSH